MRPISAILIALAFLGAGGATLMAKKFIEKRAADNVARQEELKRDVEVLVSARDLLQGHLLKDNDLKWDRWPVVTAETTKVITRQADKTMFEHLPGTTLKRNMIAGEPVTAAAVFKPGQAGIMPGLISPGKRAVGVKVDAASSASGFILPGDAVDVLVTMDLGRSGSGARFATETILVDVRVLAVDQEMTNGEASSAKSKTKKKKSDKKKGKDEDAAPQDVAMVGKTVALEVTPEQAQRLLAAQSSGKLSLLLRSMARGTEEEPRTVSFIRVIKGGQGAR